MTNRDLITNDLLAATGTSINATQEMLALGLSNIFGSFVSALPSAGAFTRSAVSSASGVQTPMAGLYSGKEELTTLHLNLQIDLYSVRMRGTRGEASSRNLSRIITHHNVLLHNTINISCIIREIYDSNPGAIARNMQYDSETLYDNMRDGRHERARKRCEKKINNANDVAFRRYHGIAGAELLNALFLLHSTCDAIGGVDKRRAIHDRPKDHKSTLERKQSVLRFHLRVHRLDVTRMERRRLT